MWDKINRDRLMAISKPIENYLKVLVYFPIWDAH